MITNALLIRAGNNTPQISSGIPLSANLARELGDKVKAGALAFVCYGPAESFKDFYGYRITGETDGPTKIEGSSLKWLLPGREIDRSEVVDGTALSKEFLSLSKEWTSVSVKVNVTKKLDELGIAEKNIYKKRGWAEQSLEYVYYPETQAFVQIPDVISRISWDVLQKGIEIRIKNDVDELDLLDALVLSESAQELDRISGRQFESLCRRLVAALNFRVNLTLASHDNGIDLIAVENAPLRRPETYVIQCKRQASSVGVGPVRELDSVVGHHGAKLGILITNNTFSQQAKVWAEGKPLDLIDGDQLRALMRQYGISTAN